MAGGNQQDQGQQRDTTGASEVIIRVVSYVASWEKNMCEMDELPLKFGKTPISECRIINDNVFSTNKDEDASIIHNDGQQMHTLWQ